MTNFIHRLMAMVQKELRTVLKDPSNRFILVVPVVVEAILFGYVATFDLKNVPYAVLDYSRSPTSAALLAHLDGTGMFQRVSSLQNPADIARVIDSERALMVIQIGPQFEQDLFAGRNAPVQMILDARNSTTADSAGAYFGAIVDTFNAQQQQARGSAGPALSIETRAWFNPNLDTRWNLLTGIIAELSIMQTFLLAALSVAREREQGTFDQTLVTPLSPTEIMIGKAIPPMLIGLVQATLLLLVARFWFQVPLTGSALLLFGGLTTFVIAGVGIGLSISALAANMQQAMLYTFVLLMPMTLLSGLLTPIKSMPIGLQYLTLLNPLRFGIDLVRRVYLEGVGIATVVPDLVALLIIGAVTLPTAAWLFRNRLV